MNKFRLIVQTLKHYPLSSLATAAGIAIATAIICGALIIGDSLRISLEQIVHHRLGHTTHTITAGERLFTRELANRLNGIESLSAAPILKSEAIISVQDRDLRINKVQLWGIDNMFAHIIGSSENQNFIEDGEVIVSDNLAERLKIEVGDFILLRIRTINPIPSNTPFVSEAGQTVTRRVKIGKIISKEEFGHFNLQASQSAPYNVFVNLDWLNRIMELDDNANIILVQAQNQKNNDEIWPLILENIHLQDIGLKMEHLDDTRDWKLTSDRVFMDKHVVDKISGLFPEAKLYLTYFVNSLKHGPRETPYSFVTALVKMEHVENPDDIVINQWLADDLQAGVGDSLILRYYVVGPLRELEEHQATFHIAGILSMDVSEKDDILMPHLPGLSDAGSCRDWETGIPIDLDKIRQKDQDYWDDHKGTPKAYISLRRGQELWQNRFGDLTTVIFPGNIFDEQEIKNQLSHHVEPIRLEYQINPVREQGLEAARGGVDFGQLFAGLGIFIIISGLLLTVLLLQFSLQKRQKQIQLFASLGFSKALIRKIVMSEAFLIILIGALAGLAISVAYTRLVFHGLNRIWYDIVRTDVLELHFNLSNLLTSLLASVLLGLIAAFIGIGKTVNQSTKRELNHMTYKEKRKSRPVIFYLSVTITPVSMIFASYALFFNGGSGLFAWLATGILLLLSLLLWTYHFLNVSQNPGKGLISTYQLSLKNLTRNPVRSFTIITLLAMGSFVIVVTAANRKDLVIDASSKTGGTGGFSYMAETTVPILRNLNHSDTQSDFGFPGNLRFVQFLSTYGDDASCLNLNRVANPRLLAIDPTNLDGRFSFVSSHPLLDKDKPWHSLEKEFEGFIPAIADQSVIQWGLGKKVGDTLFYNNANGEEIKLLLIGGMNNSVLQGNVVISQKHFLRHFPTTDGSNLFLLETNRQEEQALQDELNFIFRDYGWEMISTAHKLAGFNTVENTYLRIFFLMGAFGMLLGTVGLAIVIAQSLLERSSETAIFRALGFRTQTILKLYSSEYSVLFLSGILVGTLSALVANMSSYLAGSQNISPGFLLGVMGVIVFNGIAWILAISAISISRMKLLRDLND